MAYGLIDPTFYSMPINAYAEGARANAGTNLINQQAYGAQVDAATKALTYQRQLEFLKNIRNSQGAGGGIINGINNGMGPMGGSGMSGGTGVGGYGQSLLGMSNMAAQAGLADVAKDYASTAKTVQDFKMENMKALGGMAQAVVASNEPAQYKANLDAFMTTAAPFMDMADPADRALATLYQRDPTSPAVKELMSQVAAGSMGAKDYMGAMNQEIAPTGQVNLPLVKAKAQIAAAQGGWIDPNSIEQVAPVATPQAGVEMLPPPVTEKVAAPAVRLAQDKAIVEAAVARNDGAISGLNNKIMARHSMIANLRQLQPLVGKKFDTGIIPATYKTEISRLLGGQYNEKLSAEDNFRQLAKSNLLPTIKAGLTDLSGNMPRIFETEVDNLEQALLNPDTKVSSLKSQINRLLDMSNAQQAVDEGELQYRYDNQGNPLKVAINQDMRDKFAEAKGFDPDTMLAAGKKADDYIKDVTFTSIPPAAIEALRGDKKLKAQFNAKYGEGMAERALKK